jgi:UDP-3-O-[3-hydroxymyristoyl] N-acetylglucosamine deacetylase
MRVRTSEPSLEARVVFVLQNTRIPATPHVISSDGNWATRLQSGKIRIDTVEHLLFALSINFNTALVELDAPEIPILDGSALPFVKAFAERREAGARRFFHVPLPIHITEGQSSAQLVPCRDGESPCYTVQLDYPAPIHQMSFQIFPESADFENEIAPARTFALAEDVRRLQAQGLARGGTLNNALVFDAHGPLNVEDLRFADEPARHKMLDLIGDLSLLGALPLAHIHIVRPGHALNHRIVQALAKSTHSIPSDSTKIA